MEKGKIEIKAIELNNIFKDFEQQTRKKGFISLIDEINKKQDYKRFTRFTINFRKDYFGSNKLFTNNLKNLEVNLHSNYNYLYILSESINTNINQGDNLQDKLVYFLLIIYDILLLRGIKIPNTDDDYSDTFDYNLDLLNVKIEKIVECMDTDNYEHIDIIFKFNNNYFKMY